MKNTAARLLLGLVVALALPAAPAGPRTQVTVRVTADKATVIAFLPPEMRNASDYDSTAARDYVSLAMADIKNCLGNDYASYRVVFAERIVIRSRGREEIFDLGTVAPLVGAVLAGPDSPNARLLFAGGGPEALTRMLRPAASEYFAKRCRS
ncbi:MAG TPA: hypothetical protein VMG60_14445 [Burkholderiaceae bacterium]|nr:hypothetical protein [Burkholderiaceae bacterium]